MHSRDWHVNTRDLSKSNALMFPKALLQFKSKVDLTLILENKIVGNSLEDFIPITESFIS